MSTSTKAYKLKDVGSGGGIQSLCDVFIHPCAMNWEQPDAACSFSDAGVKATETMDTPWACDPQTSHCHRTLEKEQSKSTAR